MTDTDGGGGTQTGLAGFGDDVEPEDTAPDDLVCVVAAQEYTFEQCANGFYPAPRSYERCDRAFEHMAFYRTAPTSAVTHYARVTDRFVDDGSWMGADRWEQLIAPFSDDDEAMVFELDELRPLATHVERGDDGPNGVRGAWYVTLEELRGADSLSALAAAAGEA